LATKGNSHIQPKTSIQDFHLALIQGENRLDASLFGRLASVIPHGWPDHFWIADDPSAIYNSTPQ
jgi:hypothetical protein